jgi:hypothetical protein
MVAGSTLTGHVIVDNDTGHPIATSDCGGMFEVALSSKNIPQHLGTLACLRAEKVPVGRSSYRVIIPATYVTCTPGHAQGRVPECLPQPRIMPPLPTGRYDALFFPAPGLPTPYAIPVQVTTP